MKIMKKAVSMLLSVVMVLTMFTVLPAAVSAATVTVEYIDADGSEHTAEANYLSNGITSITPGWYYVMADTVFNKPLELKLSEYNAMTDFHIIIADDVTLTFADALTGICSDEAVTLNIYSQEKGTGRFKSENVSDLISLTDEGASFTLCGGAISAPDPYDEYTQLFCAGDIIINGSVENAGIYAGKDLTISGGTVNVPYMNVDRNITITGGNITATDSEISAINAGGTITLSLTDEASSIRSTGYEGKVEITAYLTDGFNLYNIGTVENNNTLANKTLRHAGHVHDFKTPSWVWEGYTSATATFVCRDCGETAAYTAEGDAITTKVITEPTETGYGRTDYIATLTVYGKTYTDTKSRTTHTGSHHFGDPVWEWDGFEAATLTLTCTVDGEVIIAQAAVTHVTTVEPTKTSEGECVHTAKATVDGTEYTDVQREVLPMLDRTVEVTYRNLNGSDITVTAAQILGDETELTAGWYAVTENTTIDHRPNCKGNVNLILCDDTTFTANRGINVAGGATLTVWGQSAGTGKLSADTEANDTGIGTSQDMNDGGDRITININGGIYDLKPGYLEPGIGCAEDHCGAITVNKGKIKVSGNGAPAVGFYGDDDAVDGRTYIVNIKGGEIEFDRLEDAVGIGCMFGKKSTVNISGGKIKATSCMDSAAIGSYNVPDSEINITGGDISVKSYVGSSAKSGIGDWQNPENCTVSLNWRSLTSTSVYSDNYMGTVVLYKAFKDKDKDNDVYNAGTYSVNDTGSFCSKTIVPYCNHSKHTAPVWTWNTEGEVTATAEYRCADCVEDYHLINAPVTAEDHLFERNYTASVTIDGIVYTDRCAQTFDRSLNIFVDGVYITKDNYTDVLGDGTVSYDVDTNTLTLNNANFNIAPYNIIYDFGIRYFENYDKPFHIVLEGENRIGNVNRSVDRANDSVFIQMKSTSPGMTISGSGSLSIDYNGDTTYMYGIDTEVPLTIDGCQININAVGNSYNYGLWIPEQEDGILIKNNANVSISMQGSRSYAAGSSSESAGAIDIEEGSTFDAHSTFRAVSYVNLTDSAKALGVAVTVANSRYDYSWWDGTTSLSSYKGVMIPKDNAEYAVTVESTARGTATADVSYAKKGDIVTINHQADSDDGYRFAYLNIEEENGKTYDVYSDRFTMPADKVTVTAYFYTYVDRVEPYINENGEYILGTVEHFTVFGPTDKYYSVRPNGCMGDQITDLSLSYFKFDDVDDTDLRISRYTGPTANLTKLEIPKTYQGKKITTLYFGDVLGRVSTPYEVVLTENVTTIRSSAFRYTRIAKVSGDTSGLKEIGSDAFSYNRTGGNKLDIRLDYPGEIKCSAFAFEYTNVTAHLKHATTLSGNHSARSLTYDFTDEHPCDGNITWKWSGDYTAARATYTCADSRCREQTTVDADITSEVVGSNCRITATVVIGDETYHDTVTVPLSQARHVDQVEPYIDDDGAYIPGVREHYVLGDLYFAVKEDGSVGEELSDITLLYFDFADNGDGTLTITKYTGAVTPNMDLEIPKTYDGKDITVLGKGDRKLFSNYNTFNLILTENVRTINDKCFDGLNVLSVEGDTSNLNKIGSRAFAVNKEQLHLYLNYPDLIIIDGDSFERTVSVFHIKHSTRFLYAVANGSFDFIDDHRYSNEPTWEWSDDYSSAAAVMTCTDTRCKHQETYDATVTADKAVDKTTYTATVTINDTTYTDVKTVEKSEHTVTIADVQHGSVTADKDSAYEGEKITLTITPDENWQLASLTVTDADNNVIPVSGQSFTMPDKDVTVTAEFKQTHFEITYAETSGGWVRGVYSADEGDTITLEVIPATGYERDTLTVRDSSDQAITVTNDEFTMPESNVTVAATFKKKDLHITYAAAEHGTVTGAATAQFNDEVPLTVTPDEGYALWSLEAVVDDEWDDDPVNIIDGNLIMADTDVIVRAEFVKYNAMKEPYIDENGAYILGNIAYAEVDGNYYEVKDGVVGGSVDSVDLSYFDFALINDDTEYRINHYTGPTANLTQLVIPKTFNGKPITVLGSGDKSGLYSGTKTQFELVLNENIYEIAPYTFYVLYVTKVTGDTSRLGKLGNYAFSWANSPDGYTLDITLTYPGKITSSASTFNHMKVTAHLPHGTYLSTTGWEQSMTYVFTDAHTYGEPKWSWADDHRTATVTFTCTDSRCKHQETVDATVAVERDADGHVYTATALLGGKTYTDIVTEAHAYGDPVWSWSEDYQSATATFTCADDDCDRAVTVNARVEGGGASEPIIYTATVEFDGSIYTDTKEYYTDGFGAKLYGYTLSLDGDIGVNFYMQLSDDVAHSDTAYMHFTIPKNGTPGEQIVYVKDARFEVVQGKRCYVFKCNVAAKEMTSEIKAQMMDNGKLGKIYTYSVKGYADYLIDHAAESEEWSKALPLVKAMLNYGAYAQIYFDKTSTGLANEKLDETEKELGDVEISAAEPVIGDLPGDTTYEGATLSLKSETTLSLYFKSSETLRFTCGDYKVETVPNGSYQVARIRGIKAKNIGDVFTLNVSGAEVKYSPLNYCKNKLADSGTAENLRNVLKALYLYYEAADAYFAE